MAWVQIQHAQQATWEDHQKVGALIGDEMGDDIVEAGPPPTEWFEVKHMIGL
jgi:hypothetical protein